MWNDWKNQKVQYDYNMWWDIGNKPKDLVIWCSSEIIKKRNADIKLLEEKIDNLKRVNNSDTEIEKYNNELRNFFENYNKCEMVGGR